MPIVGNAYPSLVVGTGTTLVVTKTDSLVVIPAADVVFLTVVFSTAVVVTFGSCLVVVTTVVNWVVVGSRHSFSTGVVYAGFALFGISLP